MAASVTTTPPEDEPFRFFDLARELRDHVYDHLPTQCSTQYSDDAVFILLDGPCLSLLCVSKHFSHEYTESIQRHAVLRVEDVSCNGGLEVWRSREESPKTWRKYSTRLDVEIIYWCGSESCSHSIESNCHVYIRAKYYNPWLKRLFGQMEGVTDCRLLVNFHSSPDGIRSPEIKALTFALNQLVTSVEIPALSRIEVRDNYYYDTDTAQGKWSPKAGWSWSCLPTDPVTD